MSYEELSRLVDMLGFDLSNALREVKEFVDRLAIKQGVEPSSIDVRKVTNLLAKGKSNGLIAELHYGCYQDFQSQ